MDTDKMVGGDEIQWTEQPARDDRLEDVDILGFNYGELLQHTSDLQGQCRWVRRTMDAACASVAELRDEIIQQDRTIDRLRVQVRELQERAQS